jgi:AcrR family transcriptional regulator
VRSEATRAALIGAARTLFGERGYSATGREEIVERAGVTRGALQHHFLGKQGLFFAVVEDVERDVTAYVARAAEGAVDPLDAIRRGCHAFLERASDPAIQRTLVVDAPAVLGREEWRELQARYGLGLTIGALSAAMDTGAIDRQPVEPLAHLLLAALHEAALLVAEASDVTATRAEVGTVVDSFVSRLAT